MRAYHGSSQMLSPFDRQFHVCVGVHDIDGRNRGEAVINQHLLVGSSCTSPTAVNGVAFNDRAIDLTDQ
jgi:hypothetical protein